MRRANIVIFVALLISCKGQEKPGVALENLQRILADENGIEIINPHIEADSISFTAQLTDPAIGAWKRAADALQRQPVLAYATLSVRFAMDGVPIGKHQYRLHHLRGMNPDNGTIQVRIPHQAPRTHEARRPPPPQDAEISCRIWAVQLD